MAEYIELINKYLVTRGDSGTPSYKWTDTTGEIVRCKDCKHNRRLECPFGITVFDAPKADEFCSRAERRPDE